MTGIKLVTKPAESDFVTSILEVTSIKFYPSKNTTGPVYDPRNKLWMMVVQAQVTGTNLTKCKIERYMHYTFASNGVPFQATTPGFTPNSKATNGVADHLNRKTDVWVSDDGTQGAAGDTPADGTAEVLKVIDPKTGLPKGRWVPGRAPVSLEWNYYIKMTENGVLKAELWYDVRIVIPELRLFTAKELADKKTAKGKEVVIEANQTDFKVY